jgi:3-ketoacyl-CoA synthase
MLSHFLDRLLDASSNGDLLVDSRAEGGDERAAAEGAGLTAGQWARTRKKWAASRVDVVRGFVQGYSPVDAALKLAVALLVAFSAYLAYCESCKEEHYAMVLALSRALRGAALAERGSLSFSVVLGLAVWLGTVLAMRRLRHRPVYLVDFKTYRHKIVGGPEANTAGAAATYEAFLRESRLAQHTDGSACFTKESLDFQERMLRTSCISERSVFPEGVIPDTPGKFGAEAERVALCMAGARAEAEQMMFRAVEDVLAATRTPPERIGVLVVNCSLFCPTPSLSAMLVNRFKMRADVVSYNLGGMGCSAGVIAIDLAKRLLKGTARAITARIRLRPPSPHSRSQTPPPHTHTPPSLGRALRRRRAARRARPRRLDRKHHAELVSRWAAEQRAPTLRGHPLLPRVPLTHRPRSRRQRALHAALQLPLPLRRRRHPPLQPRRRPAARALPAAAHCAHAHRQE